MKKRPFVAIIPTLEASGTNVVDDTTGLYWSVMKASASATALMTFPYGKIQSYNYVTSQAEVLQLSTIGASTSKETIVASTSYAIEIGNPEQSYETHKTFPIVHSFTSAVTLSGTPATDRTNVYTGLISKINNYAGNNATAYPISLVAYTLGTSSGDDTEAFILGETLTQETSAITAKVAAFTLDTNEFAGDDAEGNLWLYDISDVDSWDAGTKTWTATTYAAGVTSGLVVTGTAASQVHSTGIAIVDLAGYFTSKISRGGINWVGLKRGFSVDTVTVGRAGIYALGIGTLMLAQRPVFDHSKQDLISGSLEYDFQDGDLPVAGDTYTKYIFVYLDGDEDSIGSTAEASLSTKILYIEEDSGLTNQAAFISAADTAAAK